MSLAPLIFLAAGFRPRKKEKQMGDGGGVDGNDQTLRPLRRGNFAGVDRTSRQRSAGAQLPRSPTCWVKGFHGNGQRGSHYLRPPE